MKDANRSTKLKEDGEVRNRGRDDAKSPANPKARKPRGLGSGHKSIDMEKGHRGTYP